MSRYGVVVVGLGIAGRVRVRDISDPKFNEENKWKLQGVVSRRNIEDLSVPVLPEEDMLKREDVNAVLVCTEPSQHEHLIRKALNHGKHVLVEFPVVPSATVTNEFYKLAEEKGLVLHEENIALLTSGFQSLKQQISEVKSPIVKGEISLVGSYNGWAEDFEGSGGPFFVGISMIQTLYELLGDDIKATGGQLDRNDAGFTAIAKLTCKKCSDLTLSIRRTKERSPRKKSSSFTLADGSTITENPELIVKKSSDTASEKPVPGLFMQDFLMFVDELERKRDYSRDTRRVLDCIQVAEDIHKYMGLKGNL